MIKQKIVSVILCSFIITKIFAQGLLADQNVIEGSLLSPQAFGFTLHGNQKVSLFTGSQGMTIPVLDMQQNPARLVKSHAAIL